MIALRHGGTMRSWLGTSEPVFQHLLDPISRAGRLMTGMSVAAIERTADGAFTAILDDPASATRTLTGFHHVVFAGDAPSTLRALPRPSWWARWLLGSVQYAEDDVRGRVMTHGTVHTDVAVVRLSIPPSPWRQSAGAQHFVSVFISRILYFTDFSRL